MPSASNHDASIGHWLDTLGVPVRGLATDSRRVRPGDIFLAYPGTRSDARSHIPQAIEQGAAAVLWEAEGFSWNPGWRLPNQAVCGLREQLGPIAAHVYGEPSERMWVAGVTGTNGKTSCSHWIAQALTRLGRRGAVIGTLGNGFPPALDAASHTTPDAVALQALMARLLEQGAHSLAMEVSSHGLDQGRVNGVRFAAALFTNLSRDHLDYHGSMERYAQAKRRLFQWPGLRHAVLNLDDAFGAQLAASLDRSRVDVLGYGMGKGEICGRNLMLDRHGMRLEIETPWGAAKIQSRVLGAFNAANLLGVLGMLLAAGIDLRDAAVALELVQPVPGRLQLIAQPDMPLVVVDYAHTPDALEKALLTLRDVLPEGGRLWCVFGCGGERDRGKRPLMGEIATRLADHALVTSDNPRGENARAIVADIVAGAHSNHRVELDRAVAIHLAVRLAATNDIVLVAGKGHEDYQEIAGRRLPFEDMQVARTALTERGASDA